MKLAAWLEHTGTPDNVFARRIEVSKVTLYRFKTGLRVPDREAMARIVAATDGEVQPNDFYDVGELTAAPHADAAA